MSAYLVFTTDLSIATLQYTKPRGGKTENFDDLAAAQSFAERAKDN